MNHGAQVLLGRAVTKEDVVYEVTTVQGSVPPTFVATVALPNFDPDSRCEGEPCLDTKSAENSAAARFLLTFADEIAAKQVERDARVKQKRKEKKAGNIKENEEEAE